MSSKRMGLGLGAGAGAAVAAVALGVAPTTAAVAAGTPTITIDRQCYVETLTKAQPITVTGSGWPANDTGIEITDPQHTVYADANADANGNFTVQMMPPVFDDKTHLYDSDTITATDSDPTFATVPGPALTASASFEYAKLVADGIPSAPTHLSKAVKYSFAGFNSGRRIYAHYIYKKKLRHTVVMATVSGACGIGHAKKKVYPPSSRPAPGTWTVQFDNSPHYSSKSLPHMRYTFTIFHY